MTSTHLTVLRDPEVTMAQDGEDDVALLEDQHMKAFARVPDPDSFSGKDYRPAPDLEAIAETLIERHDLDAQYFSIEVVWQRKLGTSRGQPVMGKTTILTGLTKYYAEKVDIVVAIAANHANDFRITNYQLEAALFEELQRIVATADDDGHTTASLADPDLDGFSKGLIEYGAWKPGYRKVQTAVKQARLIPDGFLN